MEQDGPSLAVLVWSGMDAIEVLFDTRHSSPDLEARIYETLLYARDGWPFTLWERLEGGLSDDQYARLIRILRVVGQLQPPIVWHCKLIGRLADHASSSIAHADAWRMPAQRILGALEIEYR